ncbi:hypothetical protein [Frigoribacterium sp. CG_9.8]|uniref:hypothetical protein n=1 Tax=Frigoribacterium sp. CG_9.8 TaxID=2787733 RepID=UPI0018CBAB16|nr:hypothetical protein [Frigoribacterium sp. CG_9.8]MBG6106434.1 uncharacterized protein with PQ loop repeat [Frigoribacterium sp. CG_9.8]
MTWWHDLAMLCGWLACGLSSILALPQALALRRSPTAAGVSLLPWQALLASNLAWAVYASLAGRMPIIIQSSISAVITGAVIIMICRATARSAIIQIVITVLVASVILLTLPIPALFGLAASIPSITGWLIQVARIRKTGRPAGLSFGGMVIYVLCQSVWLIYAVATTDLALVTAVVPLLLIVSAAAIIYLLAPTDDQVRHGPSTFSAHRLRTRNSRTRNSRARHTRPALLRPTGRTRTAGPPSRGVVADPFPAETPYVSAATGPITRIGRDSMPSDGTDVTTREIRTHTSDDA